ncbi:MAG: hypothetical protein K2L77_07150, partial [Muribaculaceae bacterium]|nr:hypothetical protein [Muribaculaceae bacterium]
YTYKLAYGQVYNYRTWREGGLTQGGYFTMAEDATKRPELKFTDSDYKAFDPKQINHDVKSNLGYETGNIFVNINERGHLKMNKGDKYDALALRSWELTDNSTSNYFIEPDFHYTVIGPDGKPSTGVIEITQTPGSAWADIKAVGNGTAIVLVTYDAIGLNYYRDATKQPYLGGEYWGAIWPENTGVYIVTVGDDATGINPNMILNEKYNEEAKKVAGKYVDAEHDVFYYLDTEDGAVYTFTPEGVDNVTIAYPSIGERMATYTGFRPEGVTKNEDGSYTVVLKSGRNIVKLTDATGKSVYQILNAKSCHREITNASREGSKIFQPGDQVKIQYSGLHHPANKLAGIYNMSAYVTYNNIPNGSALILGSNQYTFGSSAGAQAVTVTLPQDIDVAETPELVMNEGVIQVNGYGDPIGNHRAINRNSGRNANFTAIAHKTYFGYLPDVKIPLTAYKEYVIRVEGAPDGAEIMLTANGKELTPAADGSYRGTYGSYSLMLSKPGYRCYRNDYLISEEDEGDRIFKVEPVKADGTVWDGKSMTEPQQLEDVYQIGSPEELAWFADNVSVKGNRKIKGCLTADIDLGDYEWTTPIGGKSIKSYQGIFDGQGYHVTGLYISNSSNTYSGLFGNTGKAAIKNITVSGEITGGSNIGGIVGTVGKESTIDRCVSNVLLKNGSYSGGIAGYLGAKAVITNCYNTADVDGRNAGGICGLIVNGAIINNSFNLGHINGSSGCGAIAGYGSGTADNCFATTEYPNTKVEYELVSDAQMRSGEVAYKLGEAFGQNIGKDEHPVIGGMKVLYNETADTYYNENGNMSGIADIKADEAEGAVYYNLHGVASDRAFKGLNIIRLSNGSVYKVFVK